MALYTVDQLPDRRIREGELLWVGVVQAANIVRDVREMLTNTFGGRMRRYEALMHDTLTRALADLEAKAKEKGYDGCIGVRISHPRIAEGSCEIFVYGTGFRFLATEVGNLP